MEGNPTLADILVDPAKYFDMPEDVLKAGDFTRKEKISILKQWVADAQRLAESANEAMDGGEENHLASANKALLHLEEEPGPRG